MAPIIPATVIGSWSFPGWYAKLCDDIAQHPNLYFDYLTEMDAKTQEDAQDVYWWLVNKNSPPYNSGDAIRHSGRFGVP